MISAINNCTTEPKVNFGAKSVKNFELIEKALSADAPQFSNKTKALIKRADELIEETWAMIKHKKCHKQYPEFNKKIGGTELSLKPIYNKSFENKFLLKIEDEKSIESVIVDRKTFDFKYERALKTDHGSATVSSFDSKKSPNPEATKFMTEKINAYLETHLPFFVKEEPSPIYAILR